MCTRKKKNIFIHAFFQLRWRQLSNLFVTYAEVSSYMYEEFNFWHFVRLFLCIEGIKKLSSALFFWTLYILPSWKAINFSIVTWLKILTNVHMYIHIYNSSEILLLNIDCAREIRRLRMKLSKAHKIRNIFFERNLATHRYKYISTIFIITVIMSICVCLYIFE